ncbi:MAG: XRE family transcriptional regulator, partial [Oscillibacter sp.]|nr:XRE family transcriptional regulator [Oscillibacter sp.]
MRQTDTGALIAQLRKEQGLTQKQLADQLHISDNTNEALKICTGDYIAFGDHDDLL